MYLCSPVPAVDGGVLESLGFSFHETCYLDSNKGTDRPRVLPNCKVYNKSRNQTLISQVLAMLFHRPLDYPYSLA